MNDVREHSENRLRGAARVVDTVRGLIIAGELRRGDAVPSHLALAERLGLSTVAVQNGLNILAGQRFVETRPRVGTFVVDKPPHLNTYALVFCTDPALPPPLSGRPWTRHYMALANEATRIQQETGKRILHFHGIDEHVDSEDRQRLVDYLETQRVAGIIFTSAPFLLRGSPILELPGIPRVAIATGPESGIDMAVVNHGTGDWHAKALDWLAAQGRRRVATLGLSSALGPPVKEEAQMRQLLAERGMSTEPRWQQLASIRSPDTARRITELLMADRERPDALLITDDNFVEPALAGIAAAGVRVPDELVIVAHANFPWIPSLALPARLLGYDTTAVLHACIDHIDQRRRGEDSPRRRLVTPLWQDEYQPQTTPVARRRQAPAMAIR